jgi:hypothetical protein
MQALRRFVEKLRSSGEIVWPPIALEATGFSTRDRHVLWSEINSIAEFKRDLNTIDDVWFQLETPNDHVMVCEEQPGFNEWQAALAEQFEGVRGWQEKIVLPPFAENFTVLYSRT